jgi:hypothetical protein
MKNFQKIDWNSYNKPPYWQQWLCREDTLKLATFGDRGLAEVDDKILELKDQWDLDNTRGYFLDRIGKFLNEDRNGNPDDIYRVMLKLRKILNTSDGSIPSIIKAIKFLYSSEVVHIVPNYPAGLIIEHDGEGTPGLNFNKIIAEIVAAGVSYSTTELFDFIENMAASDSLQIIIHKDDMELLGDSIKYNGAIKYDGVTLNEKAFFWGRYNGVFRYNGDLAYNGSGKTGLRYLPKPPFKYSSGIIDQADIDIETQGGP